MINSAAVAKNVSGEMTSGSPERESVGLLQESALGTSVAVGSIILHQIGNRMPRHSREDPRLTQLTKIALALPETSRQIYGSHAQFLVRKKTFSYFLDNHHGDGIVAVTGKVLPGDNKALADAQPRRFYLPAYIASRGWVALRLDVGKIDWDEVSELLISSYTLVAARKLAERVKAQA